MSSSENSDCCDNSEQKNKNSNLGKRKLRYKNLWERNKKKARRNEGLCYTSSSGKVVHSKKFHPIDKCCSKQCYKTINVVEQENLFKSFWLVGDKEKQDNVIAGNLISTAPKTVTVNAIYKTRPLSWKYQIQLQSSGVSIPVCQSFFIGILQISRKRVRVIQGKLSKGDMVIKDNRGKHTNRPNRIKQNVWDLAQKHLSSIPHAESHYCAKKTKKLYFTNPTWSVKKLFECFQGYFRTETGMTLGMKYATYHKFFRTQANYSFRRPRTDVCDLCTECTVKLKLRPNDACRSLFNLHKCRVKRYQSMKKEIVNQSKGDMTNLVIEFDFAQNLALPKLNVTSQFYKRLIWMYVFNIHVHNNGTSTLYWYLESDGKKNANAVCSMLYHFLSSVITPNVKHVTMFSDSCGGQNKNLTMVQFCCWLSKVFNVEVHHIFPVRGHSYCQCDRNFSLYSSKVNKMETVETPAGYVSIFKTCRTNPKPFQVVYASKLFKKWSVMMSFIAEKIPINRNERFAIQKYVQLKYSHGVLSASKTYMPIYLPFKVFKTNMVHEYSLPDEDKNILKPAKVQDVRSLLRFLSEDSQKWYEENVFH